MMSEQHEDVGLLSKEGNPSSSIWMAHWTKTSYCADPLYGSGRYVLKMSNNESYMEQHGTPQFKLTKTRPDVQSIMGMTTYTKASPKNAGSFSCDVMDALYGVYRMPGGMDGLGDKIFGNSRVREKADLSESSHFPMYNINRKVDHIMKQKPRPILADNICVPEQYMKSNISSTRLMAISSAKDKFWTQSYDEKTRGHADSAVCWIDGQLSPMKSCSCSNADNESSESQHLLGVQPDATKLDSFELDAHNVISQKKLKSSECKSDEKSNRSMTKCLFSGASDETMMLKKFGLGDFQQQLSAKEHQNETHSNVGNFDECKKYQGTGRYEVENDLLRPLKEASHPSAHAVDLQRTNSMGGFHKLSSTVKNLLRTSESLSEEENSIFGPTKPNKRRDRYLFEMLSLPSISFEMEERNPNKHEDGHAAYVSIAQNDPFSKRLRIDEASTNLGGSSWSFIHKTCAAFPSKQGAKVFIEEDLPHPKVDLTKTDDKDGAGRFAPSIVNTVSMEVDHSFPDTYKIKDLRCDLVNDGGVYTEPSSRWVERLRHPLPYPPILGAKRLEDGEEPLAAEVSSLFNSVFNSNMVNPKLTGNLADDKKCEKDGKMPSYPEGPFPVLPKNAQGWIRRWCCGDSSQVPGEHSHNGVSSEECKNVQAHPDPIGPLPSIAAMAMMGKAMSKFRPCELQRKGPSVVWNT